MTDQDEQHGATPSPEMPPGRRSSSARGAGRSIHRRRRPLVVPRDRPLPPARPGVRYVPVVFVGVVIADDRLRAQVERRFHWPMIVLALAMLPLLAIEIFSRPAPGSWLAWATLIAAGLIWLAFLIEFVVKISIAEHRLEYVKHNWLDVIILVAPFLRWIRAWKVARTAKVFTLRGVGMKFARGFVTVLIGMEATERLLERFGVNFRPDRPAPESMTRLQLMRELKRRRAEVDAWEAWYEDHETHVERYDLDPAPPKPDPTASLPPASGPQDPPACESPSPS